MKPPYASIFKAFLIPVVLMTCISRYGSCQDLPDSLPGQSTGKAIIQEADSSMAVDSLHSPFIRRIEISLDYLKLISFALPNETKVEGGFSIITKPNIAISIEVGYGSKMPDEFYKNADYTVEGMYGRAGLSYHFPFNPETNFFIGGKYGMSNYQDEATYEIESTLWNPYQDSFQRTGLSAQWAEFIAGSESRFKGNFYLGFIFRFRAMISYDNFSPLEVYAVPGYGRTMDKTVPALNLYIKYMINFK